MSEAYLVGIDSGGTKNEVLVADLEGKILNRLANQNSGFSASDVGLSALSMRESLRIALEGLPEKPIAILICGLAGLDTKDEARTNRPILEEVLGSWQIGQLVLLNDAALALANGTNSQNAIVLVGGTGSNCLGHNDQGETAKAGGLNFALSDDGSGFDAGRLALKAAIKSLDGRGPKSVLEQTVFSFLKVKNYSQLKEQIYHPLINKKEIAALAPLVIQAYHDGDKVATGIINYCLDRLVEHVVAVATKLHLHQQPFDLILTGSFLLNLVDQFSQVLIKQLPLAQIVSKDEAPVYGAIKIAQRIYAGEKFDDLLVE